MGALRTRRARVITTYDNDFATARTLFRRPTLPGSVGRLSQTWVRTPAGWKVVATHVCVIDGPGLEGAY